MTGRKGRSRKQAVTQEQSIVGAGQENIIDSTTEPINGNLKESQTILVEEEQIQTTTTQRRGKPRKVISSKEKSTKEDDVVIVPVPVIKARGRGKKIIKNIDIEEIPIIDKINIAKTTDKIVVKRGGRKKNNAIATTNGDDDSIQKDKEKINGNTTEIPVVKKQIKSKIANITKQLQSPVKSDVEKIIPPKSQTTKSLTKKSLDTVVGDDIDGNKPIAVVQPFVDTKKAKGRKKAENLTSTTARKHKINEKDSDNVADNEFIPAKKGRAAKTKANNNMKENAAASIADDIQEKAETKKTMTKKKTASEEIKATTTTGRRGKRVTASIEKDKLIKDGKDSVTKDEKLKVIEDDQEENIVEVVENKSKNTGTKKRKINDTTDTNDKKMKIQPAENEKTSKTTNKKIKMNATATLYDNMDFSLSKDYNLKVSSWNVAGLRAWLTKGGVDYITHEKPDIICLQELKCAENQIPDEARIPGYHPYWLCKPGGFNGVAIYSKIMPINVEYGLGDTEQDDNSRIMTAEYEKFYLICVYVPNSGRKLVTLPKRLRWNDIFHKYLLKLNEKKPVIICGDLNVAHNEIDIANPKSNKRNAGFTQEERDGMSTLLSLGFVDTFRHFYPNQKDAYTYWTYMANARAKNVGWRLDYFLVSEKFMPKIVDNVMRSKVLGSDHCPITLFLNI